MSERQEVYQSDDQEQGTYICWTHPSTRSSCNICMIQPKSLNSTLSKMSPVIKCKKCFENVK